jgi:hypothetical protein
MACLDERPGVQLRLPRQLAIALRGRDPFGAEPGFGEATQRFSHSYLPNLEQKI